MVWLSAYARTISTALSALPSAGNASLPVCAAANAQSTSSTRTHAIVILHPLARVTLSINLLNVPQRSYSGLNLLDDFITPTLHTITEQTNAILSSGK